MKERLFWIGLVILVILYFKKCDQKACPVIKEISYDTAYIKIPGKDSIAWKTPKEKLILRPGRTDSFYEYEVAEVDTAAILEDYASTRYYEDTTKLEYADIITRDSVSNNRILRHGVSALNWNLPVVTKTVTYMQPKKSEIYAGLNFGYNNVGANVIFKDTSNRIWEAGAFYTGKWNIYLGRKWKIK